jgi:IS30 family transposase
LGKDCTTISKEVRKHKVYKKSGSYGKPFKDCIHRFDCDKAFLCGEHSPCQKLSCKFCYRCISVCKDYQKETCLLLEKPPYVCNACAKRQRCTLEKADYSASTAQKAYIAVLSESREGVCLNDTESARIDGIVSPLVKNGQSIHHIALSHSAELMVSEKSLYKYVNNGIFSVRNIDLPRRVRLRPRMKKREFLKIDKSCRIGRTYKDYQVFMEENPDTPVVEMDSVEGVKGGKVLLTIHFVNCKLMLAFLRDANTAQSVTNIFARLYLRLGAELFKKLFPLLLTDNGSEFTDPNAIEFDPYKHRLSRVFYCDPSAPHQKGAAENNREMIRRIVPKGRSFDEFSQEDISRMMNHINSYGREGLNDRSPYEVFSYLFGEDALKKLGVEHISPDNIILRPSLLER